MGKAGCPGRRERSWVVGDAGKDKIEGVLGSCEGVRVYLGGFRSRDVAGWLVRDLVESNAEIVSCI